MQDNKYYVGKTNNLDNRFHQHKIGQGSYWTRKYKPIKILKYYNTYDNFDEDKETIKYMNKYGIDNVRGGSFSKIKLDKEDIYVINKMINTSLDKCFKCNKTGHFIRDCPGENNYENIHFIRDYPEENNNIEIIQNNIKYDDCCIIL